ncbi:MAG TPA: phosphoribosylaminoimidazolesuccinocarboxamide synthase [Longimicrobiales bacterium]|nr:phosphoribosylaminoimidazolesuccinocarboxamide synthase [Longimicrobiales bacterium]
MSEPIAATSLPFPLAARGKVRDIYDVGDDRLLLVATDRISAFDVVLSPAIPRKGVVLTQITAWWLSQVRDLTPNHLISVDPDRIAALVPALDGVRDQWARRAMLVRKARTIPVECVVRGYLSGSAWREYREHGTLAGEPLPGDLRESSRLDTPIFSPAVKAQTGHDENITFDTVRGQLGDEVAEHLRTVSLALYARGRDVAARAGIILADTKFEFGLLDGQRPILIDEVMTPDSSRFWPAESYAEGRSQPSLDKQPVRDYLEGLTQDGRWDKTPPAPELPDHVVEATTQRYLRIFRLLTGSELDDFRASGGEEPEA